MSKNCIDCDIVLDLLPLYLDGKTGEESNTFVKVHLKECAECREVHRFMNSKIPQRISSCNEDEALQMVKEKRRKRKHLVRTVKRIMILLIGLIGYVCLMGGVVAAVFVYLTSG